MTLPKPEKRGPKPRRRIRNRSKSPRARLIQECTVLLRKITCPPGSECAAKEYDFHKNFKAGPQCYGAIQCAHGFPKKVHPYTRFMPINTWPLCQSAHSYLDHHPGTMAAFMLDQLGPEAYAELARLSVQTGPQDLEATRATLLEEIERRGL